MAPSLDATYPAVHHFDTTTATKQVSVTVAAGDVLVIMAISEDNAYSMSTPTGGGLTYTLKQDVSVASYTRVTCWTVEGIGSGQTFNVSITRSTVDAARWGYFVYRYSGSAGIGATSKTNVSSGAPSLGLTTTGAGSAVVMGIGDWAAVDGTSHTYRTVNVSATEQVYYRNTASYSIYEAYYTDAGAAGAKTLGISTPSGMKYSIVGVEVLGTTGTIADAATASSAWTAETPGVTVAPNAAEAAATVSVPVPTTVVGASDQGTALTVAALAPVPGVGTEPPAATVGVSTPDPTVTVEAQAGTATIGITAPDPTVSTANATNAPAETAGVALAAGQPTIGVSGSADVPVAAMAALDASTAVAPTATDADVSVAAQDASVSVFGVADIAGIGFGALDATVTTSSATNAPAGVAAIGLAAVDPSVFTAGNVNAAAGVATAVLTAESVTAGVSALAGVATVGMSAFDARVDVTAFPATALMAWVTYDVASVQPPGQMTGSDRSVTSMTDSGRSTPDMSGGTTGTSTMGGT